MGDANMKKIKYVLLFLICFVLNSGVVFANTCSVKSEITVKNQDYTLVTDLKMDEEDKKSISMSVQVYDEYIKQYVTYDAEEKVRDGEGLTLCPGPSDNSFCVTISNDQIDELFKQEDYQKAHHTFTCPQSTFSLEKFSDTSYNLKIGPNDSSGSDVDGLPITAIDFCSPVSADGTPNYTLLVFQVIGYIIIIIKILVPIILIVLGSIDLGKATVSGDDKIIMEKAVKFGMRVLTGVIIFFIPTILDFFLSLVSGVSETMANYRPCTNCIFYPNSKCNARKFNSTTPNDDGSNNKNNKDNINNPTVEIK